MARLTIALAVFAILALSAFVDATNEEVLKRTFLDFASRYNKIYKDANEFNQRYQIFKINLAKINQLNQIHPSAQFAINKFADLSTEEFSAKYLINDFEKYRSNRDMTSYTDIELPTNFNIPETYDWRDHGAVTPTYNQGQCGSCWAFSATEAIESQWFLAGNPLPSLSPQQIVDCDTGGEDEGCNGGDTPTAYEYVIKAGGMETQDAYPYTGEDQNCAFSKSKVVAHISNWTYITTDKNETEMQIGLVNRGPLSICVDALSWQFYVGGVISDGFLCGNNLDHCVLITGYSDQRGLDMETYQVWNIRNSWGEDWGYGGYLYVERGYDLCGVGDEVTIPLVK